MLSCIIHRLAENKNKNKLLTSPFQTFFCLFVFLLVTARLCVSFGLLLPFFVALSFFFLFSIGVSVWAYPCVCQHCMLFSPSLSIFFLSSVGLSFPSFCCLLMFLSFSCLSFFLFSRHSVVLLFSFWWYTFLFNLSFSPTIFLPSSFWRSGLPVYLSVCLSCFVFLSVYFSLFVFWSVFLLQSFCQPWHFLRVFLYRSISFLLVCLFFS